jgi:hypothetical protein
LEELTHEMIQDIFPEVEVPNFQVQRTLYKLKIDPYQGTLYNFSFYWRKKEKILQLQRKNKQVIYKGSGMR